MTTVKSIKMVNILCLRPYTICVMHSENGKLRSENDFISIQLNNNNFKINNFYDYYEYTLN